ncbi:MAG: hypothetical protein WCA85_26005 [Paraburkholderia sp.]|uniref:hypothetical protein n=1 Tax=Paraburkholderia sp. TaxID=1926495 RepID=UPI003C3DB76A
MNGKPSDQSMSAREIRRAAQRAASKGQQPVAASVAPRTSFGHLHNEAFSLMWYACECGHRERIWNSRDGVTAFCMACPSCGEASLKHVNWNLDKYAPSHAPLAGQRVWISLTRERALEIAKRTVERVTKGDAMPAGTDLNRIADAVYNDGHAPDLVVYGYVEAS